MVVGNDWDHLLKDEFAKEYYVKLWDFLLKEYKKQVIYPCVSDVFNAFKYTPYENVKAVIIGQDPYHGIGQAHGLCFSVKYGVPRPPSLNNIFKELHADLGVTIPEHGCLKQWSNQGVLLLNSVLTVREGEANSHRTKGWEVFTDKVIELLNKRTEPMVFLLWGEKAKAKINAITNNQHLVLTAAHPSPLSAYKGFFGCKHFSKTNNFLRQHGKTIQWEIEN